MIYRNISIVRGCCFSERPESNHIKKKNGWDSFPVKALILYGLNYWLSLVRVLFKRPTNKNQGSGEGGEVVQ